MSRHPLCLTTFDGWIVVSLRCSAGYPWTLDSATSFARRINHHQTQSTTVDFLAPRYIAPVAVLPSQSSMDERSGPSSRRAAEVGNSDRLQRNTSVIQVGYSRASSFRLPTIVQCVCCHRHYHRIDIEPLSCPRGANREAQLLSEHGAGKVSRMMHRFRGRLDSVST